MKRREQKSGRLVISGEKKPDRERSDTPNKQLEKDILLVLSQLEYQYTQQYSQLTLSVDSLIQSIRQQETNLLNELQQAKNTNLALFEPIFYRFLTLSQQIKNHYIPQNPNQFTHFNLELFHQEVSKLKTGLNYVNAKIQRWCRKSRSMLFWKDDSNLSNNFSNQALDFNEKQKSQFGGIKEEKQKIQKQLLNQNLDEEELDKQEQKRNKQKMQLSQMNSLSSIRHCQEDLSMENLPIHKDSPILDPYLQDKPISCPIINNLRLQPPNNSQIQQNQIENEESTNHQELVKAKEPSLTKKPIFSKNVAKIQSENSSQSLLEMNIHLELQGYQAKGNVGKIQRFNHSNLKARRHQDIHKINSPKNDMKTDELLNFKQQSKDLLKIIWSENSKAEINSIRKRQNQFTVQKLQRTNDFYKNKLVKTQNNINSPHSQENKLNCRENNLKNFLSVHSQQLFTSKYQTEREIIKSSKSHRGIESNKLESSRQKRNKRLASSEKKNNCLDVLRRQQQKFDGLKRSMEEY